MNTNIKLLYGFSFFDPFMIVIPVWVSYLATQGRPAIRRPRTGACLSHGLQVGELVFGAPMFMWRSSRIVISAKQELPGRVQALLREEGITSRRHSCARGGGRAGEA